MTERTAKGWWELLDGAPNVAGPWQAYWTEEQRVETMRVRRLPRLGARAIVVLVYGPLFPLFDYSGIPEHRVRWAVQWREGHDTFGWGTHNYGSLPGDFASLEAGMKAADEALRKEGWLLMDNE